jgi:hypothetical protein
MFRSTIRLEKFHQQRRKNIFAQHLVSVGDKEVEEIRLIGFTFVVFT